MIKKLLIGASALALATTAQAQVGVPGPDDLNGNYSQTPGVTNESQLNQQDNGNDAAVDQTGGDEGYSLINQGSNAVAGNQGLNRARVTQSAVSFAQAGRNNARIDQISDDSAFAARPTSANGVADRFAATIPSGFRQDATITQVNHNAGQAPNNAVIRQGSASNGGNGNYANIFQQSFDNDAIIEQLGDGSASRIQQAGFGSHAENTQGDSDYSEITQFSVRSTAYVQQAAAAGVAGRRSTVIQGSGGDHYAEVTQAADEQESFIQQQAGFGNVAIVYQTGSGDRAFSSIYQDGDGNRGVVEQDGADGVSLIDQDNVASATSIGNRAHVIQTAAALRGFSDIRQLGDNNDAKVRQAQADVKSYITQTGDGNTADVRQTSVANALSVVNQTGGQNTGLIQQ